MKDMQPLRKMIWKQLYFKAYKNPFTCTRTQGRISLYTSLTNWIKTEYLHCVSIKHITIISNTQKLHLYIMFCKILSRYMAD